jgi:signal transduction histidine kinase
VENLARNALRHGASPVRLQVTREEPMALIRLSDAGQGVDPALVPRLFQRFASGDPREGIGRVTARRDAAGRLFASGEGT